MEGSNKEQELQDAGSVVEQNAAVDESGAGQQSGAIQQGDFVDESGAGQQSGAAPQEEAVQKTEADERSALAQPPMVAAKSAWPVLRSLFDPNWWRDSGKTAIAFAPFCVVPAVFAMLSGTLLQISMAVSMERLRHNPVEFTDLILAMGVLLLGALLSITFIMLSFGAWLVRLSAYSVALIEVPSIASLGTLSSATRKTALQEALRSVEPKKIHVGAVLLWVTLYMMPPFIVFAVCVIGKLVTMQSVMGAMALHLPDFVNVVCCAIAIPNFLFLMNFSLVALVVAACSSLKPQKSAHMAFSLSLKYFFPLSAVTVLFTGLSMAIGAPNDLMQMLTLDSITSNKDINLKVVSHVWQSAINILLFPLSFTPICDILRPHLQGDLLANRETAALETTSADCDRVGAKT